MFAPHPQSFSPRMAYFSPHHEFSLLCLSKYITNACIRKHYHSDGSTEKVAISHCKSQLSCRKYVDEDSQTFSGRVAWKLSYGNWTYFWFEMFQCLSKQLLQLEQVGQGELHVCPPGQFHFSPNLNRLVIVSRQRIVKSCCS